MPTGDWPPYGWSYWRGPYNAAPPIFTPWPSIPVAPVFEYGGSPWVFNSPTPPPPPEPQPVKLFDSVDEYFEFLEDVVTEIVWEMNGALPALVRKAVRTWAEKKFGKYKPEGGQK
jgi:hypothetical protein